MCVSKRCLCSNPEGHSALPLMQKCRKFIHMQRRFCHCQHYTRRCWTSAPLLNSHTLMHKDCKNTYCMYTHKDKYCRFLLKYTENNTYSHTHLTAGSFTAKCFPDCRSAVIFLSKVASRHCAQFPSEETEAHFRFHYISHKGKTSSNWCTLHLSIQAKLVTYSIVQ